MPRGRGPLGGRWAQGTPTAPRGLFVATARVPWRQISDTWRPREVSRSRRRGATAGTRARADRRRAAVDGAAQSDTHGGCRERLGKEPDVLDASLVLVRNPSDPVLSSNSGPAGFYRAQSGQPYTGLWLDELSISHQRDFFTEYIVPPRAGKMHFIYRVFFCGRTECRQARGL